MDPASRNSRYYNRLRSKLHALLGGACALCGSQHRLAVDHVEGRNYPVRRIASHQRMRRYLDEFEAGVKLRLLCWECDSDRNGKRGKVQPAGLESWRSPASHPPKLPRE